MHVTQIYLSTMDIEQRPELPDSIVDAMDSVAEAFVSVHDEVDYCFYDNERAEKFLNTHYDEKVFNAYRSLRSLAYRADLLRYCILLKTGGWYVDAAISWVTPVEIPDHIDLLAFRSIGRYSMNSWSCDNGVIFARAGHPALEVAIFNIINNVDNKYYGMTPLCPTGPSLWGRSIAECATETHDGLFFGDCMELTPNHPNKNKSFVLPDGTIIAECKPANGGDLTRLGCRDSNNYNEIWHSKQVYQSPLTESLI